MLYTLTHKPSLAAHIGTGGLSDAAWQAELAAMVPHAEALRQEIRTGQRYALTITQELVDEAAWAAAGAHFRQFDRILILGTGGSSLGAQTLYALCQSLGQSAPALAFLDNVDPATLTDVFRHVNWVRTGVVAISKSGKTPETLAQLLLCIQEFQEHCPVASLAQHFLVITEEKDSALKRLQARYDLPFLPHPREIGGRFSVFSVVGLFPLWCVGMDVMSVRRGGASVLDAFLYDDLPSVPAVAGAAILHGLWQVLGINETVVMPYIDRFATFGLWFRQLWAESLGKEGKGWTPIPAMGCVDQHSQLQLYLDGPQNKLISLIFQADLSPDLTVDAAWQGDPDLAVFAGKSLADVMRAEQTMTAETLARHGRPARIFTLSTVSPETLGALFMHFMLETLLCAARLGVNPVNQPAVEASKVLFYQALSAEARLSRSG